MDRVRNERTHITNMRPLACLDGDLKSGVSVADLILIMGLIRLLNKPGQNKPGFPYI